MTQQNVADIFKAQLLDLLLETFESVQGIYLDRGTSLFETLETISAEEASRPVSSTCASIAAQVEHIRYYLRVILEGCFEGRSLGKIDWDQSWQLQAVTPVQWRSLKKELIDTHQAVLAAIDNVTAWQGEDDIGASLAILAHTAYHLGEIRQALCTVR